jgi:hypothetical protein
MNGRADGQEIEVRIGELVIDGGAGVDRAALAAAVASELGRLVAAGGVRPVEANYPRLDGGTIPAALGGDSAAVGQRVARAVHRTLGGDR